MFHDGTPLNADAVKFSLERTIALGKGVSFTIASIKEIKAVDDFTVRITTKEPFTSLSSVLASPPAGIGSPTAVRKWGDDFEKKGAVGTGLFKLEGEWLKDNRLVIVRNEDYWDKDTISGRDYLPAIC